MSEQRVDFVLNTYNSPCLKDNTRDIQGEDLDDSYEIYSFGSGQKTPSNFLKKFFIALLIMNAFAYSVMKKECYRWRMFMTYVVLMMKPIHVLLSMQYMMNN